jgi:hypothetical protein
MHETVHGKKLMPESASTRMVTEQEHLTRLRALSREITSALSAIEHNNLQALQDSIAAQELLCAALNEATRGLPHPHGGKSHKAERPVSPIAEQIRTESAALAHLNRVYAAVLKRAQVSASLIFGLYRNYGQGYAKDAPAVTQHHTWSCEG